MRPRGIALIAVLWLIALLTVLATAVATMSVSHRRAAQHHAESVLLDTAADSAIRLTVLRIIAPKSSNERVTAGAPLSFELSRSNVDVTIEREQGRLDLNTAEDELIFALFAANGWSEERATTMAARIADWKDADDQPREEGAEQRAYSDAGLGYGPRNGPFESVQELRQVLGGEAIDASLLDSLTVYTHSPAPVATIATTPAKLALELADKRQLGGHRWLPVDAASGPGVGGIMDESSNLLGEVVRIDACARKESSKRCRSLIARLTGSTQHPLQVFAWSNELE